MSLATGPTEQSLQAVLHYELNGAFVAGPVEHPELIQENVIDEELVIVTPLSHSSVNSLHDVKLLKLLVFKTGCAYRAKLLQLLQEEGLLPIKMMEFGSLETIIGCVGAGLGISLMPRSIVAEAVQQGKIRCHELQDRQTIVTTVFIRRKDTLMTPALSAFLSEMRTHFS